ncbi:MAG: hypothetical protein MUF86_02670 [Akkermansiaceae bacterium]|jgi:hypothetical protein|nr:hypothetical protein [Akkermansiaceae bacterium]
MKSAILLTVAAACLLHGLSAQSKRTERKSLLHNDPEVVYLERFLDKPIELKVIKDAPIFSDREGKIRLGTLVAGQTVPLEAITDKIYRVRGRGTRDGVAGWVAPWAFSSTDPEFVARLKEFYQRQIQVQKLIDAKQIAVGMTLQEVELALGKPGKTSLRRTEKGQSGRWEYVDYEEVKHYITRIDPVTGQAFRQFSHVTQIEKGRTNVDFEDDVVTAIEESEDRQGGNVRIVVPPLIFGW